MDVWRKRLPARNTFATVTKRALPDNYDARDKYGKNIGPIRNQGAQV
jgi:hypothetical protein